MSGRDQRGLARPVDQGGVQYPYGDGGNASDIGAVEVAKLQSGPEFTVTTLDDTNDSGFCHVASCTFPSAYNNAISYPADPNAVPTITFAANLSGTARLSSPGIVDVPRYLKLRGASGSNVNLQPVLNISATGNNPVPNVSMTELSFANQTIPFPPIINDRNLTLTHCTFSNNTIHGSDATITGAGIPGAAASLICAH